MTTLSSLQTPFYIFSSCSLQSFLTITSPLIIIQLHSPWLNHHEHSITIFYNHHRDNRRLNPLRVTSSTIVPYLYRLENTHFPSSAILFSITGLRFQLSHPHHSELPKTINERKPCKDGLFTYMRDYRHIGQILHMLQEKDEREENLDRHYWKRVSAT